MSGSDWLLGSDPSIRWQVMRDLLGAPQSQWRAEQAKEDGVGKPSRWVTLRALRVPRWRDA